MSFAHKAVIKTLNIKDVDNFTNNRIKAELDGISDHAKYIRYLERWVNHIDLKMMTGYNKFLELSKRYKKGVAEQEAKEKIGIAKSRAESLAYKVKSVSAEVQRVDDIGKYKPLHFGSFKTYFTGDDKTVLESIGTLHDCIILQRSVSGEDALHDKIEQILTNIALKSKYIVTNPNQKRVMSLVSMSAEKMEA